MASQDSDPPPFHTPKLTLEARVAVNEEKLKTGQKAFEALRKRDDDLSTEIGVIKEAIRPKPFSWGKALAATFGIAVTLAGFIWTMSWLFSERPTRDEVRVGEEKTKQAIEQLRVDQRQMSEQQVEHRVQLQNIGKTVEDTSKKLDILIERGSGGRRRAPAPAPAPKPTAPP